MALGLELLNTMGTIHPPPEPEATVGFRTFAACMAGYVILFLVALDNPKYLFDGYGILLLAPMGIIGLVMTVLPFMYLRDTFARWKVQNAESKAGAVWMAFLFAYSIAISATSQ